MLEIALGIHQFSRNTVFIASLPVWHSLMRLLFLCAGKEGRSGQGQLRRRRDLFHYGRCWTVFWVFVRTFAASLI